MPTLEEVAERWLKDGPPLIFTRSAEDAMAAHADERIGDWRFTKFPNRDRWSLGYVRLKARLKKDFTNAPQQVRVVAKEAWNESDAEVVILKRCDVLDEFRDNWAAFSAESKTWLRAWKKKRGVKRKGED